MCILASFVLVQLTIGVWVYLWTFYPVPLMYISVFVPVPSCFDYCSFIVYSEIRELDSSNKVFLSQEIALAIQGLFCENTVLMDHHSYCVQIF